MTQTFRIPPVLPGQVLWRQKEQFSDGVGYSWIDHLKLEAERTVTDLQMKFAASRFPHSTPRTKVRTEDTPNYLTWSIFLPHSYPAN